MEAQLGNGAWKGDHRIDRALRHIPKGSINIFDKDLRYLFVAGEGLGEAGLRAEELIGKTLWEVFPPELVRYVEPFYKQALEGHSVEFELAVAGQWYTINASPVLDAGGEVESIIAVAQNCDERKRSEAAQQRLATIVESSQNAIISTTLDGVITSWNKSAERFYGYSAAEAIGQPFFFIIPPERMTEMESVLAGVRRGEPVHRLETVRRSKSGRLLDVSLTVSPLRDETGQVVGVSSIAHDISEVKQARQALERSERLYHTLVRNFPNGAVVVFDRDLRLLLAEGRGLVEIGMADENLVGRSMEEVLQPVTDTAEREELLRLSRLALTGEKGLLEINIRDRYRCIQIVPLRNEQDEIIGAMTVSQDITEKKRAEAELEERGERFRQLAENMEEVFWMSDPTTREVLYINPAYAKVWGRSQESLYLDPSSFMEAVHPADREAHRRALDRKQATGELDEEYRIVRPDGEVRWIWDRAFPVHNARGEVYRLVGIAQDITKRRQAEEALKKERDFSSAVLETMESLVIVLDAEGRIVSFNRACEQLSGLSCREVQGRKYHILLADEDQEHVERAFESLVAGEFPAHYENYWQTGDGSNRLISWSNTALLDGEGKVAFVVGTGLDITERRQARAARIEAQQALQQAHHDLQEAHNELERRVQERTAELAETNRVLHEQIAERQLAVGSLREAVAMLEQAKQEAEAANRAKSEFLSRMSHELRTPMNAILGFGQILEARDLSPRDASGVQHILKAGRHLLQLINEILEISRIEANYISLSIEPIKVASLVREALDMVQPLAATRGISLQFDFANGALPANGRAPNESQGEEYVLADRQRLHQVLLNLLSNAIKYNHEGGTVALSLHAGHRNNVTPPSASQQPVSWRIEVRDTGPGIAPEDLEKAFLPFERLGAQNTVTEGTGIGLTLTKRLVELMHGRIGVESQLGQGSTFWVQLPAAKKPDSQTPEYMAGSTAPTEKMPEETTDSETTESELTEKEATATRTPATEAPASTPNGSTPVTSTPTVTSTPAVPPSAESPLASVQKPVTILYIEDNLSNTRLMEMLVEKMPHIQLLTAIQGDLGIELAQRQKPDLILLDMHLPDARGDEVLQRLKADPATQAIPVVMVSADATSTQIERLLDAGAEDYMTKPLDIRNFLQAIERIVERQR